MNTKPLVKVIIGLVVVGLVGIHSCGVMKRSGTELESVTEAYQHRRNHFFGDQFDRGAEEVMV